MHTLASKLALIAPHLPDALITDAALARLTAQAATLPAALGHCLYVECRPDQRDAADLIVDVSPHGFAILAGSSAQLAPPPALTDPSWRRITTFANAWMKDDQGLRHAIDGMWLEFDLHHGRSSSAAPSIFIDFRADVYHASSSTSALDALTHAALVVDHRFTSAQRATVAAIVASASDDAVLLYAGFMFSRALDAIRVCFMGLSRHMLRRVLTDVCWRGDIDGLMSLADDIADPIGGGQDRPAILHLDIDADGSARTSSVGLEYPFSRRSQLAGHIAENSFLDVLVSQQLMTAWQRRAITQWTGYDCLTMPHELWPSVLVRRVNHVKLVQAPSGPMRAKVYLCAEHSRMRSARTSRAAPQ